MPFGHLKDMKKLVKIIFVSVLSVVLASSCTKEDFGSRAPEPPSMGTLKIDYSAIPSESKIKALDINPASIYLKFWNGIYESIINIPIRGFQSCLKVAPEYIDGEWIWNSCFKTYNIRLVACEQGNKYVWELQVAGFSGRETEYFTWIKGWSSRNGKNGEWSILIGPDDTDVFITSVWTAKEGEVTSATFTCSVDHMIGSFGEFFNDSSITYLHSASDNAYDSTLEITYAQIGNILINVTVEWNSRTGDCRIRNAFDGAWHDWD